MASRPRESGGRDDAVAGLATLHVVPGVPMLRPAEAAFEKMLAGFAEHQRARRLSTDTIKERERVARQVRTFADAYPWEASWNRALFDRWSAMLAASKAASTMSSYQLHLRHFLTYITDPAYEWPQVCLELFGTFPANAIRDLNSVRHSQEYMGRPSGNRPLTRAETKVFFGQMDPEIRRLQAEGHKGALATARDLALFSVLYGWGLRRREAARLETYDWRRQAKLPEFGDYAALAVRWGKASAGQPPRRRTVISVWPWAVQTVQFYMHNIRPLFYVDRDDDGVMFPTERDAMISLRSVNDRFKYWRELAHLADYLSPHCLRHTYVTRLIESGYDAQFVTDQVGHSHAATTAIYTAVSSDFKNLQVRQALDAAEEDALRRACVQAEVEADMDDTFDDLQPPRPSANRRKAR